MGALVVPVVGDSAASAVAEANGVCTRPLLREVIDRETGSTVLVPIPCGSTRETVCVPCAVKARRLRIHQCREGWHLTEDPPMRPRAVPDADPHPHDLDEARWADDGGVILPARRVRRRSVTRSTRHLDGFPELPKKTMGQGTTGAVFVDEKTGREHRPSMFLTLTLGSYGRIRDGVPVDPASYDYRRAALDALTFSRLVDRFWQNMRRCAGYRVQYFAAVEAQKRLAPHLHAAVRGAIPRATIKAVAAGTYFAAWWPPVDVEVYSPDDGEGMPVWDSAVAGYVDPGTGELLPTWDDATRDLDQPAHVATFGKQLDIKGLLGGTPDSDRAVRYLCKYLTKSIAGTYTPADQDGDDVVPDPALEAVQAARAAAYEAHMDRLHEHTSVLPCGPECGNWLRYGVQPKNATPGLTHGCLSPAHERDNLGLGGRRVLVSRQWSGKTLTQHRADRAAVVREVLEAAGITPEDADRLATSKTLPDGSARYVWREPEHIAEVTYLDVIAASLRQAMTRRAQYDAARQAASPPGSGPPAGPVDNRSATAIAA
ncbi:replication initiator [Myceligenerans pegani]|uniref:replication initiator n=1 Tax=Myceligenerans pegani TaxID=2776917 RepID=UPI001CEFD4FF|nr:replication initiator [Myceligenerans sp. TRM 65318]